MSIRSGLARNRTLYRRFAEEEANPPKLPERERFLFDDDTPPRPEEEDAFRLTQAAPAPASAEASVFPIMPEAFDLLLAEASAQALLQKLDDEARLQAQNLEEE